MGFYRFKDLSNHMVKVHGVDCPGCKIECTEEMLDIYINKNYDPRSEVDSKEVLVRGIKPIFYIEKFQRAKRAD